MLTSLGDTCPVEKFDDVALVGAYRLRRVGRSGLLGIGLFAFDPGLEVFPQQASPLLCFYVVLSRTVADLLSRVVESMHDLPTPWRTCVLRQGRSLAAWQINSGFPMPIHPFESIAQIPDPQPSYPDGLDLCHHYLR